MTQVEWQFGGWLRNWPAMDAAAQNFVPIAEMQARASEIIAEATGAEAGLVASGGAACLTLAAAACITGDDPAATTTPWLRRSVARCARPLPSAGTRSRYATCMCCLFRMPAPCGMRPRSCRGRRR